MEWISVDDRLPEDAVPVWGSAVGQGPGMVAINSDYVGWLWGTVYSHYHVDGEWCCDFDVDDDYGWITHWMPLPNPPEADK